MANLTVEYVGLCHFIENENKNTKIKMCIVLPEAPDHFAVILPAPNTKLRKRDSDPSDKIDEIEIAGKKVVFDLKPRPASLKFEPNGLVDFKKIAGSFADKNSEVVDKDPSSAVSPQILIPGGEFSTMGSATQWELPDTLSGKTEIDSVASVLLMDVIGLNLIEIIVSPVRGPGASETYILEPDQAGGNVKIILSHDCKKPGQDSLEDEHFVHHYQLLSGENLIGILKELKKKGKHVPLPKKKPAEQRDSIEDEGGRNCNCLASSGKDRPFDRDADLPSEKTAAAGISQSASAKSRARRS